MSPASYPGTAVLGWVCTTLQQPDNYPSHLTLELDTLRPADTLAALSSWHLDMRPLVAKGPSDSGFLSTTSIQHNPRVRLVAILWWVSLLLDISRPYYPAPVFARSYYRLLLTRASPPSHQRPQTRTERGSRLSNGVHRATAPSTTTWTRARHRGAGSHTQIRMRNNQPMDRPFLYKSADELPVLATNADGRR